MESRIKKTYFRGISEYGDLVKTELPIIKLENKKRNQKIMLYGLTHIAFKSFYEKVSDSLQKFDYVLYEMLSEDKKIQTGVNLFLNKFVKAINEKNLEKISSEEKIQETDIEQVKNELKLLPQTKLYNSKNKPKWINADLNYSELNEKKGFLTSRMHLVLKALGQYYRIVLVCKPLFNYLVLNEVLGKEIGRNASSITPKAFSRFNIRRENKIYEELEKIISKKNSEPTRIAILYGVGHSSSILDGLKKRGYEENGKIEFVESFRNYYKIPKKELWKK